MLSRTYRCDTMPEIERPASARSSRRSGSQAFVHFFSQLYHSFERDIRYLHMLSEWLKLNRDQTDRYFEQTATHTARQSICRHTKRVNVWGSRVSVEQLAGKALVWLFGLRSDTKQGLKNFPDVCRSSTWDRMKPKSLDQEALHQDCDYPLTGPRQGFVFSTSIRRSLLRLKHQDHTLRGVWLIFKNLRPHSLRRIHSITMTTRDYHTYSLTSQPTSRKAERSVPQCGLFNSNLLLGVKLTQSGSKMMIRSNCETVTLKLVRYGYKSFTKKTNNNTRD